MGIPQIGTTGEHPQIPKAIERSPNIAGPAYVPALAEAPSYMRLHVLRLAGQGPAKGTVKTGTRGAADVDERWERPEFDPLARSYDVLYRLA